MPSVKEIDVLQKERLFDLLLLEKLNDGKVKGLNRQILKTKAGMTKEDVAYVVAMVAELKPEDY